MTSKYTVTELTHTADAVQCFESALREFMEFHEPNTTFVRGVMPAVNPRDDASPADVERVTAAVSLAAGRARRAPSMTGTYYGVAGAGNVDPVAGWHTITKPKPLLEIDDIFNATAQMRGRLESMIVEASVSPPPVSAEAMHPRVWMAAERLWRDGHFREAVGAAASALTEHVKSITRRSDVSDTALWQEAFSDRLPAPGKPRLRWPGDQDDRTVVSMNAGLRSLASGVQLTIRNPAIHEATDMPEQDAVERLATLSLLARWVDQCDLAESP